MQKQQYLCCTKYHFYFNYSHCEAKRYVKVKVYKNILLFIDYTFIIAFLQQLKLYLELYLVVHFKALKACCQSCI